MRKFNEWKLTQKHPMNTDKVPHEEHEERMNFEEQQKYIETKKWQKLPRFRMRNKIGRKMPMTMLDVSVLAQSEKNHEQMMKM